LFLCVLNSSILGGICSDINKNSIRHVWNNETKIIKIQLGMYETMKPK
jgi:hypothetical protein